MSYASASRGNVTMIDNLPTLDDLDNSAANPQSPNSGMQGVEEKYSKFIRNRHSMPSEAGMVSQNFSHSDPKTINEHFTPNPNYIPNPFAGSSTYESYQSPEQGPPMMMQMSTNNKFNLPDNSPTCLDVADHIQNCPICSQFYKSNSSPYIISIIILAIICLLLLKKVLDI